MKKKTGIMITIIVILVVGILLGITINRDGLKKKRSDEAGTSIDEITTELDDLKVEDGKWYRIESGDLEIYEFGENGELKETVIDLFDCTEETQLKRYVLEGSQLTISRKTKYTYVEEDNQLRLIKKYDDGDEYEIVYYNTFKEAKENSEDYEFTTYALWSIADEDGFAVKDGVLLGYLGKETEITVPKGIREIDGCAFSADFGRGVNLEKVKIGNDVKKINAGAFSFTEADIIVIEEGVEEIGDHCFMDSYIEEIYFPESLTEIGGSVLETEEGLDGTIIHCVEDSVAAEYFELNKPYGKTELVYESNPGISLYGIIGVVVALIVVAIVTVGIKVIHDRKKEVDTNEK